MGQNSEAEQEQERLCEIEMQDECESQKSESIPIDKLPPLPARGDGYWSEPIAGIFIVTCFSGVLVAMTFALCSESQSIFGNILRAAISCEAAIAFASVAYLLFAGAGVVKRSAKTCYPIPPEVEMRLKAYRRLDTLTNIEGKDGTSYCVRCLVWRPSKKEDAHHCSICQRCVTGFDHHCGVFGRCIVSANMPCFSALLVMMVMGILTTCVSVSMVPITHPHASNHTGIAFSRNGTKFHRPGNHSRRHVRHRVSHGGGK